MEAEFLESPSLPLTMKIKRLSTADMNGSIKFDVDLDKSFENNNLLKADEDDPQHECAKCQGTAFEDHKEDASETASESADDKEIQWIQCDVCNYWFHIQCVGMEAYELFLVDAYHCPTCQKGHGPSKNKELLLNHRYHFSDKDEEELPTQVGTKKWIEDFIEIEKHFPSPSEEMMPVFQTGSEFMAKFNREAIWDKICMILNKEGLGLKLPEDDFDLDALQKIVNLEESIETIDVYMQQSSRMKLRTFFDKWREAIRPRLYNMLSFEFSNSKLLDLIDAPKLMYELSWVHRIWNFHDKDNEDPFCHCLQEEHKEFRPDVAMFCLLGMGGSYTDFHIDFGGSSVWYHVFKGQKIFYILPPTNENLEAFRQWTVDEKRSETFMADMVPGQIARVVINPGQTVMIPSGYIHAVYTPVDSIVFGGNFLHELNVEMQLKVYKFENEAKYETNFMFPNFELVNWYAAAALLERLQAANDIEDDLPNCIISGLTALSETLKAWKDKDKKEKIDTHEYFFSLVADLGNELKIYKKRQKLKEGSKSPSPKRRMCSRTNSFQNFDGLIEGTMGIEPNLNFSRNEINERPVKKPKKAKAEKIVSKKEKNLLSNIFNARQGTGQRRPKPSAWVTENVSIETGKDEPTTSKNFFAQFSQEERERIAKADAIGARDAVNLGDDLYISEDEEAPLKKRKKSIKKVEPRNRQENSFQKKVPKETTVKQRLAKKLKIKPR